MAKWEGKVAVITGASSGIGAAIAEELVKLGILVVGIARRKNLMDDAAAKLNKHSGKFIPLKADITNEPELLQAFAWIKANLGPVAILINNAAYLTSDALIDGDSREWSKILDTNLLAVCVATREAVKDMRDNEVNGHIIHINGICGHFVPKLINFSVAGATKAGITALTETLRQELNSINSKIKITSISPGLVDTDILKNVQVGPNSSLMANLPKLQPKDVADAVVYVLSTPPHVQVAGISRRKDRLDALAKNLEGRKGEFHSIGCDVANEKEILKAFQWIKDKLGPISILINSAGCQKNTNLIEGDTKLWKEMFDTNVLGLCIATREAVKDMRANKVDGHIIHLNSFSGHRVVYSPHASVYPASKHAVTALTETLRQELNSVKSKIKITSISPGFVDTELLDILGVSRTLECGSKRPMLLASDVADAIMYALSTPPHVQVHEIKMRAVEQPY